MKIFTLVTIWTMEPEGISGVTVGAGGRWFPLIVRPQVLNVINSRMKIGKVVRNYGNYIKGSVAYD